MLPARHAMAVVLKAARKAWNPGLDHHYLATQAARKAWNPGLDHHYLTTQAARKACQGRGAEGCPQGMEFPFCCLASLDVRPGKIVYQSV